MVLNLLKGQRLPHSVEVIDEMAQIKKETKQILDKVLELGNGDWAVGIVKAFEQGVMDIPFAPSRFNAGKMLPARDNEGKIRFLEFGNVPFSDDVKAFNTSKLEVRAKYEEWELGFQMTVDDIFAVGKGNLIGRPAGK